MFAGAVTSFGLQRAIHCVQVFCTERGLKVTAEETKIVVIKNGGK
jgi:hypothetical protein